MSRGRTQEGLRLVSSKFSLRSWTKLELTLTLTSEIGADSFHKFCLHVLNNCEHRCVQLTWSQAHDNPAAWAEVINKLKECILSAFDSAVSQREEDVKRSEGQRSMPGWNFCTFFILKAR
jgi:hypothetical protein